METIGFVGLGVMGKPMAENIHKAGYRVLGYDLLPENIAAVPGAEAASSLEEIAATARKIVVMLPDSPHVESVMTGKGGLLERLSAGAVVADMSTISPKVSQKIHALGREKGVGFLDAPVSGGRKGAIAGALSIMVGGDRADFDAFLPIFRTMGKTILLVGGSGAGQTMKLCNQSVVAVNIQAICEAFSLAMAEGLDLGLVRQVLQGGAAGSWMMENLAPQMIAGDASAGFRIHLQIKDLRLAMEAAFADGVPMPATALATNMYLEAMAHGEGDNGNQAMYRTYERLGNREFR